MKKFFFVLMGLGCLSSTAWATKARMQALGWSSVGSGEYVGSRTYSDTRSVFKNPAYVNEFSDYVVAEWGADANTATASVDSSSTPSPEGGIFRRSGKHSWGIYYGNTYDSLNCARLGISNATCGEDLYSNINFSGTAAGSSTGETGFLEKDNVLDLFFGSSSGDMKWGANIQLARGNDEQTTVGVDKDHFSLVAAFGILKGPLDIYLRANIIDKSEGGLSEVQWGDGNAVEGGTDEWKRDFGLTIGVAYEWKKNTFFAEVKTDGFEHVQGVNDDTGTGSGTALLVAEADGIDVKLGWGRTMNVTKHSRIFTDAFLRYVKVDFSSPHIDSNEYEHSRMQLPIIVGYEAMATKWLTLRGSVSYKLFDDRKNSTYSNVGQDRKISQPNTVDVAAGATLEFGKLKVDGMIGTTNTLAANPGRGPATDNVGAAGAVAEQGILSLDNLMSRVAVHYWF